MNVPEGWKRVRFGDIASLRNGVNFDRADSAYLVPIVGVGDFVNRDSVDDSTPLTRVTLPRAPEAANLLQARDLLFVRSNGSRGLVGRCIVFNGTSRKTTHSGFTIRARVHAHDADKRFVHSAMRGPAFSEHLRRLGSGSSINNLSQETLANYQIALPPLPEQRKIAEILSAWDDAIERGGSLLAAKHTAAKTLLNRLVDQHSDRPRVLLGEIFTERAERAQRGVPLLSVTQRSGVIRHSETGRKDSSSADRSKYKSVMPSDIAYNTMRMWQGASGLVLEEGIVSPAYTVVTPHTSAVLPRFAAQLFKSDRMMFEFQRYSQGITSDTWNLKFPAFARIHAHVPSLQQQTRISKILDAASHEIEALDRQLDLLRQQKRGLMQKLLTGEVRVNVEGDI